MKFSMKKSMLQMAMLVVMVVVIAAVLSACGLFDDDGGGTPMDSAQYVIQYTDDTGVRQITVKAGEPYSISPIPSKTGYDFMGLYDAEHGGTQYVNAQGSSVGVFTDNRNIVLFPQFKAKTYTIVLDYCGGQGGSVQQIEVVYNERIESLPVGIYASNKEFKGWYTQPDCGGIQIGDEKGLLQSRALLSEENFDLSASNGSINLYAGFTPEQEHVTLYFEDETIAWRELEVDYGTDVSELSVTYVKDGAEYIVKTWSQDGFGVAQRRVFSGEITQDVVLYELSSDLAQKGTSDAPYLISTKQDFVDMVGNSTVGTYYKLTNDLDLGDWSDYGMLSWSAESRSAPRYFSGIFDGNDHTITYSIRIGKTSKISWAFGLFPTTRQATIANLRVDANITTYDPLNRNQKWDISNDDRACDAMVGGVVGYANSTTIENCSVTGSIRYNSDGGESDTCVAGVVGYALSSALENCSSSASLYSRGFYIAIGGVVACYSDTMCSNLSSTATIASNNDWRFGQTYKGDVVARPNHVVLTKD